MEFIFVVILYDNLLLRYFRVNFVLWRYIYYIDQKFQYTLRL